MKATKTLLFVLTVALISTVSVESVASCVYEQIVQGENLQIGTMLTWSTSYEENNAFFVIEKSEGGIDFNEIGSVKGSGDSDDLKEYNFLDVMANASKNYYRLKQVDSDGTSSYSEVIVVPQKFENNFMVARMSSVSTIDLFEVTIDALKNGEMSYELMSWKQETLFEDKIMVTVGLNDLSVDLTDQRPGIYKLVLKMDGEDETLVLKKIQDELQSKPNVASKNKLDKNKN